jgi:uncharacterized cupin superfamily protein
VTLGATEETPHPMRNRSPVVVRTLRVSYAASREADFGNPAMLSALATASPHVNSDAADPPRCQSLGTPPGATGEAG